MTTEQSTEASAPSQVTGNLNWAQGQLHSAVAAVLPSGQSEAWAESGAKLKEEGVKEVEEAKNVAAGEALYDKTAGKLQSAYGYIVGDQSQQTEGNLKVEQNEWKLKQASDGSIPLPSVEGVKGKLQSVAGMVTGDQAKQMEGNIRAEKADWVEGQ